MASCAASTYHSSLSFSACQETGSPFRSALRARWTRAGGIRATLMHCVRSGRPKPEFVRRLLVTFWLAFWRATMRRRRLALRRRSGPARFGSPRPSFVQPLPKPVECCPDPTFFSPTSLVFIAAGGRFPRAIRRHASLSQRSCYLCAARRCNASFEEGRALRGTGFIATGPRKPARGGQ